MKTARYNLIIAFTLLFAFTTSAQKKEKSFKERFIVKPNVVIDINTKYTDIEIETWDKNEVVVEAFMKVEGEEINEEMRDKFYDQWDFEAVGNKDKVRIKSGTSSYIDIHSIDFNAPDYGVIVTESLANVEDHLKLVIPEISIASLELLDSLDFVIPDIEIPPLPDIDPIILELEDIRDGLTIIERFDFDKYKKDKGYLKEWKERNKEALEGANIKIGRNSISISTDRDDLSKEELERRQKELERRMEEREKRHEKRMKEYEERLEKRMEEREKRIKKREAERKLALVKRQEAMEKRNKEIAKHRVEASKILKKRERLKIKKLIKIRAPKDAKFNMNVRYGSMSFPK